MSASSRRSFLKTSAAVALGTALPVGGCVSEGPPDTAGREGDATGKGARYDISLGQWSLHRALFDGDLAPLDFARAARDAFNIGAVEYVNQFFMDRATDAQYLQEMKTRAEDAGVESLLIMCDGEGALGHPDSAERAAAVANHHKWVEAAAALGCHSIRVNAQTRGKGSPPEQKKRVADGLRRLTAFAAEREINVLVENHGGLSSDAEWLAGVMNAVDHARCGTLPDFGNWQIREGESYDPYDGVRTLMPHAQAISAKTYEFNDQGQEATLDYAKLMRIVLDAGYRGHVGIEYEGDGLSEREGIRATKQLLVDVRNQLENASP
ncbi:TIM barrel protein [Salinibacter altiplanensis]|uniref:TIM barrel protein n=1 Tax=Salinibacter altiplanensis TaxID=1803181 RepID=UPI000C9FFA8E|nr:TIM barrel protein [Salinibacter altiplanensis]